MEPTYVYRATLDRIIDGDTAILMVDLGFKTFSAVNCRLHGVDSPELHGATKLDGEAARDYSYNLLHGKQLVIQSYKDQMSFARWVCDVWVEGDLWAERLLEAGHAVPMVR